MQRARMSFYLGIWLTVSRALGLAGQQFLEPP